MKDLKYKSFVASSEAFPDDIAGTTQDRVTYYRKLGQNQQTAAISARLAQAGEHFCKLEPSLLDALKSRFPSNQRHALATSPRLDEVHNETLAVLAKAQDDGRRDDKSAAELVKHDDSSAGLFDYVEHWLNEQESLVICAIRVSKNDCRYYLIDQAGERLTDIDKLEATYRKQQQREAVFDVIGEYAGPVTGVLSLVLLALVIGSVLNPWYLLGVLALQASAYFVSHVEDSYDSLGYTLGWSTAVAVLATGGFGISVLVDHETRHHEANVLACEIEEGTNSMNGQDVWRLKTPQGDFSLDPGTYNGKFFDDPEDAADALSEGKSYSVVFHGGGLTDKYITEMSETGSIGTCGK